MRTLSRSNERSRWVFAVGILILVGVPPLVAAALGRLGAIRFGIARAFGALALAQVIAALTAMIALPIDGLPTTALLGIVGAALGCASVIRAESLPILGRTLSRPC